MYMASCLDNLKVRRQEIGEKGNGVLCSPKDGYRGFTPIKSFIALRELVVTGHYIDNINNKLVFFLGIDWFSTTQATDLRQELIKDISRVLRPNLIYFGFTSDAFKCQSSVL